MIQLFLNMKKRSPHHALTATMLSALFLAGCAGSPPAPDWQVDSKSASDRLVVAAMQGNERLEAAELARVRSQLASTGRVDLRANAELLYCATRVASLVFESCPGFEALRQDAPESARAYADYLAGRLLPPAIALLPASQRRVASGDINALPNISDPLSPLVAAAVLFQTGQATPAVLEQAVDTASAQGWRRPLLAWLGVQARRAELAGRTQEAARLRRRIELTQGTPPTAPASPGAQP